MRQNTQHPLTSEQKRLWITWMLNPTSTAHNIQFIYKLSGDLNLERFKKAVEQLVRNHYLFNTHFIYDHDIPYQKVNNELQTEVQVTDFNQINTVNDDKSEIDYIHCDINQPIDLLKFPLCKIILYLSRKENVYYLASAFPHILADAATCKILLHKLSEYYNDDNSLKLLEVSDTDNQEILIYDDNNKDYWCNKLREISTTVNLNSKKPLGTSNCHRIYKTLTTESVNQIKIFSKNNKTTEFLLLFSVFYLVLHQYSNQQNITILYPTDIRDHRHKSAIGFYVNLLPMTVSFREDLSLQQLLSEITTQRKHDKLHQNFSFSEIVQLIRHEKKSEKINFNTIFSRTQFYPTGFSLKNIKIEFIPFYPTELNNDLSLLYDKIDGEITFCLEYNENIYEENLMMQLMTHYLYVLSQLEQFSTIPLKDLCILSPPEKKEILKWGAEKLHWKDNELKPLSRQFENMAIQFKDQIAIQDDKTTITYGLLNSLANKMARHIILSGVGKGSRIALLLQRNYYPIAIIIALLKAGYSYVPIDSSYPVPRIQYILDNAKCSLLITETNFNYVLKQINIDQFIILEDFLNDCSQNDNHNLNLSPSLDDEAYVIYTSGSTGHPKGVPIKNRNLSRLFKSTDQLFSFTPSDKWALVHSLAFDFSVWEMWGALFHGSTLFIISDDIRKTPFLLYQFISNNRITVFNQTPTSFKSFIEIDRKEKAQLVLRYIIFGGEKLLFPDLSRWFEYHDDNNPYLINMYGITETTVHTTFYRIKKENVSKNTSIIGRPLPDVSCFVLNSYKQLIPPYAIGELFISGAGLSSGYINNPILTKTKFIASPLNENNILYTTGDIASWHPEAELEYIGREDHQIKIHGYRIELDEINIAFKSIPNIIDAFTILSKKENHLITFYKSEKKIDQFEIFKELKKILPYYMIPKKVIFIKEMPLTSQNKIDKDKLITLISEENNKKSVIASNNLSEIVSEAWKNALKHKNFGFDDNFFDAGGDSLALSHVHIQLEHAINETLPFHEFFNYPTINSLTEYLSKSAFQPKKLLEKDNKLTLSNVSEPIAIIGMAARFPGAKNIEQFWENLCQAKESITFYNDSDLLNLGIPKNVLNNPLYVKAKGVIKNGDHFDAEFFNIAPREAEVLDPQQRIFLECVWHALEDAGYVSEELAGKIAVFAGQSSIHTYQQTYLSKNENLKKIVGDYLIHISNSADFLANRVSYKFNFSGPSINVQTGCSTSLVAVCNAAQALINRQCDLAIAGGVSLNMPLNSGYLYQEGMILSPDGHCRAFDEKAAGTVPGNGVGVIILKRLSEAQRDGDHIEAVIKGFAVNNDGSHKVGFTAPSKQGQMEVIRASLQMADCSTNEIGYIETHGTGTRQGDPIEISALEDVFQKDSLKHTCAIGSVKTNIGHLDAASGIAGLIKAILCVKHGKLVPSLHFKNPNEQINFKDSPFYVSTQLMEWSNKNSIRKAGVSSFAIGGTNSHLIIEEAPKKPTLIANKKPYYLITISAKNSISLMRQITDLYNWLDGQVNPSLENLAYTLNRGRAHFRHRCAVVVNSIVDLKQTLKNAEESRSSRNLFISDFFDKEIFNTNKFDKSIDELIEDFSDYKKLPEKSYFDNLLMLAKLYIEEHILNWDQLHIDETRKRISLPTYSFNRKRYWVELPSTTDSSQEPIYLPTWQYSPNHQNLNDTDISEEFIIFCDDLEIGNYIGEKLARDGNAVQYIKKANYYKYDSNIFYINPSNQSDYEKLFTALKEKKFKVKNIIYLWSLSSENEHLIEKELEDARNQYVDPLIHLCRSLKMTSQININIITNYLWQVLTLDTISPCKSLLLGPVMTIPSEYPYIKTQLIDISIKKGTAKYLKSIEKSLLKDIYFPSNSQCIAYRSTQRFAKQHTKISLAEPTQPIIYNEGVYIITGGLGGIALNFAQYFSNIAKCKIILIHRSSFPNRSRWDEYQKLYSSSDLTHQKIIILKTIENNGSTVDLFQTDVTQYDELAATITKIKNKYNHINGVIHAAGIAGGSLIQNTDGQYFDAVLAPKFKGAWNLHLALVNESLDFMALCSALSSIIGTFGQVAYNSANAFLDQFAIWRSNNHGRTISISWDQWKDTGMTLNPIFKKISSLYPEITNIALAPNEALSLFSSIVTSTYPHIIVSKFDLEKRFHLISRLKLSLNESVNNNFSKDPFIIKNQYEEIVQIWKEHLGINEINPKDNFFDLGGDSLLAIQLSSALREKLNLSIYPHHLIEYPTIETLYNHIYSSSPIKKQPSKIPFCLVPLRKLHSDAMGNFFLIHPVGGTVYVYRDLSTYLNKDFNIYGLQSQSLDGKTNPEFSVSELATAYIEVIQAIQPHGPYYLAGASFGGTIAYEMALRFLKKKEEVKFIALIDTPSPEHMPKSLPSDADIIAYMLTVGAQHILDEKTFYSLSLEEQLDYFLKNAGGFGNSIPHFDISHLKHYLRIYKANIKAMLEYLPPAYTGETFIHYFRAVQRDNINPMHPEAGWKKLLGKQIIVHEENGNHITMLLRPHVKKLAGTFNDIFSTIFI